MCLAVAALTPEDALAWGPGVHLALGNSVLAKLCCLPPLVAGLLARHGDAFRYGCLSADIFIGKGTEFNPEHSHNWVTGLKLLNTADDARTQAYAYGYLCHLAADVVAHNYYVPNEMWAMHAGSKISHVYVEAQADRRFRAERETAFDLFRKPNRDADGTLLTAMRKRRLPFLVKKQIVMGSLKLTGRKTWGESLRLADRLLPWHQNRIRLDDMFALSENLVFEFLSDPNRSAALTFDPIGSRNLRRVRQLHLDGETPVDDAPLFVVHRDIASLPAPAPQDRADAAMG